VNEVDVIERGGARLRDSRTIAIASASVTLFDFVQFLFVFAIQGQVVEHFALDLVLYQVRSRQYGGFI
jgi:hypothetical protein